MSRSGSVGLTKMPSQSNRMAAVYDADVTRVASVATDPMGAIGIKVRSAVLRAIKNNKPVEGEIRKVIGPLKVPMLQAMTGAFVMGTYRTAINAGKRKIEPSLTLARADDTLGKWSKIVEFARLRVNISEAELDKISKSFDKQATDAIDGMSGVLEVNIRRAIRDALAAGEHRAGTYAAVRKAFDDSGMTNAKPFMIETQARTQTQLAYTAGRLKANEDPAIQDVLWGYEYITVGDDRVRPSHAALDGLRLPKDHPRWKEIMPPCGWNCRCTVVEVFKDEKLATINDVPQYVEVNGERVRAGADDGFAFNPLDVFNGKASAGF